MVVFFWSVLNGGKMNKSSEKVLQEKYYTQTPHIIFAESSQKKCIKIGLKIASKINLQIGKKIIVFC
jgi:hypothetical protein